MTDIVERLRAWHNPNETITGDVQLYLDAADEIERLRQHAKSMIDAMDAENELLRAALLKIAEIELVGPDFEEIKTARDIAFDALAQEADDESAARARVLAEARNAERP